MMLNLMQFTQYIVPAIEIGGGVVCLANMNLSKRMTLPASGFGVLCLASLGSLFYGRSYGYYGYSYGLAAYLPYVGMIGWALLVGGLAAVFGDVKNGRAASSDPYGDYGYDEPVSGSSKRY